MIGINELKDELEKINTERNELRKRREERRMVPLAWDKHIRKAIGYLFRYGRIKLDDLAGNLKIHIKDINYIVKLFEKNRLIIQNNTNSITITEEGSRIAKDLGFKVQLQNQKDRFLPPYIVKDIEESVNNFIKTSFPPDPYLFQWYFTPRSVQNIVEYMIKEFDIEGRNVACLMAPTIGLSLSLTGYSANEGKGVYVFDKDENIIQTLRNVGVHAIEYDITEPVPEDFRGSFDCVVIDPPYDEDYYFVALSRAIDLLGGEQYKTIYIVVPPPEIAYLRRIGFPPLILSVLNSLDRCWLLFEDIKKEICRYLSPPYEIAALSTRLGKESQEIKETLENWRSSDLIKASIFRDVVPPLPGKCELSLEPPISYKRYKRRFLECSLKLDEHYKEYGYTKPIIEIQDASEWDEFAKEFNKPPLFPYSVFIHDIGDWDTPSNKLIKLKGAVANFLWERLKTNNTSNTDSIVCLVTEIKQVFLGAPKIKHIENDIKVFIKDLRKLKLIT